MWSAITARNDNMTRDNVNASYNDYYLTLPNAVKAIIGKISLFPLYNHQTVSIKKIGFCEWNIICITLNKWSFTISMQFLDGVTSFCCCCYYNY